MTFINALHKSDMIVPIATIISQTDIFHPFPRRGKEENYRKRKREYVNEKGRPITIGTLTLTIFKKNHIDRFRKIYHYILILIFLLIQKRMLIKSISFENP